ncbi:MAG: hypothetical protein KKE20_03100 [Nanoarchaeota archaeon]|nr:hypothetical protein [Nanoarchaeota archaeon]
MIRLLDIEIPYWIFFICIIIPLLIIAPFSIGPNCHGYCTEEIAGTLMTYLLFAMIGGLVLLTLGISAWQILAVISPKINGPSLQFEKIDGIMGLSFGLGALTILLVGVALVSSYGFSLAYLSMLIMPVGFGIASFFLIRYRYLKVRGKALLSMRGTEITTDFLNVEMDMLYSINHRHPYQITSVGVHPTTGKKMRFFSDYIWLNPTGYAPDKIKVKVDPYNPNNYHMDISFLKEKLKDIDWDEIITEKFRIKD